MKEDYAFSADLEGTEKRYNFDEVVNRRNNNSDKWTAYPEDVLPMWIADMDFKSPKEVIEGLKKISENGVYGYGKTRPSRLLDAIIYRLKKLYGWSIHPDDIVMLPSLVAGFNIAANVAKRRNPAANYLFHTPAYPPFFEVSKNVGLEKVEVPLKEIPRGDNELYYEIDFAAMESKVNGDSELFMLCSPHNPSGRVFTPEELAEFERFAVKHNLLVLSDEIHAELNLSDQKHTPYALISDAAREHTITLISASKTFNLPGLGGGFAIIENASLREEYEAAMMGFVSRMNVYAIKGAELAFDYGDEWLEEVKAYLKENRDYAVERLSKIPGLKFTLPEATFLLWLDFGETVLGESAHAKLLEGKLALNNGAAFGVSSRYVRLNFATSRSLLEEGLEIIEAVIEKES